MKLGVAMVFLCQPEEADKIISSIRENYSIEILHTETSYSRLWIKRTDREEQNNEIDK